MTEAEDKLLTAALENWVSGRFGHLQLAVLKEREQAPSGEAVIRMHVDDWRILTDKLRQAEPLQMGREFWVVVAKIEGELPSRPPDGR